MIQRRNFLSKSISTSNFSPSMIHFTSTWYLKNSIWIIEHYNLNSCHILYFYILMTTHFFLRLHMYFHLTMNSLVSLFWNIIWKKMPGYEGWILKQKSKITLHLFTSRRISLTCFIWYLYLLDLPVLYATRTLNFLYSFEIWFTYSQTVVLDMVIFILKNDEFASFVSIIFLMYEHIWIHTKSYRFWSTSS